MTYFLRIRERGKPPETRRYEGELTFEERQKWQRILKFANFEWELMELEKGDEKCQTTKQSAG